MQVSFEFERSTLDDCTDEKIRLRYTEIADTHENDYAQMYKEADVMKKTIFDALLVGNKDFF